MFEPHILKAVIIDDSAQARKLLRLMLLELCPDVDVVGEAENVDSGLTIIQQFKPDAVFLDIEMPGKTGLQLAESLKDIGFTGSIIFTTAFSTYAIQAFRLSAIDYLLKPIQEDQLVESIQKIIAQKASTNNALKLKALQENLKPNGAQILCIPSQQGIEYVNISDIYFLKAEGSYVRIVCKNNIQKFVAKNLKYFENSLESIPKFIRTHRSYLVNMDEVVYYSKSDGGSLSLSNGVQIPVSRERKATIQEFLK